MKIVFIFLLTGIFQIATYSCQEREKIDLVPEIDILSNIKNMERIYLSQIFESIYYVRLESSIEYPLLYITSTLLDFSDQYILASDRATCNLYDFRGKFVRKIGKKGRGPGEYTFINGVTLTKDKIYIRDMYDLNEYTIKGEFIKKYIKCFLLNDIYLNNIYMLNDSMIFSNIDNQSGHSKDKAVIINKSGEVIRSFKNYIMFDLEQGVTESRGTENALFYNFGNQTVYKDPYNDTLFYLNDKLQLVPTYVCNLGKYKEPYSQRGKALGNYDPGNSDFISISNIFQTNNYLFINCNFNNHFPAKRLTPEIVPLPSGNKYTRWYNTNAALGIFDKNKGTLVFSEPTSTDNKLITTGLYNDIDAGPRFFPNKQLNDSTMVMIVTAKDFKSHITSDDFKNAIPKFPENKIQLKEYANNLSEYDSPILMIVTFKSK